MRPAAPIARLTGVELHFAVGRALLPSHRRLLRAVDGVDLSIRRGETLAIVGESGCGKSTLARVLLRLLDPTAGRVEVDGVDVTRATGRQLARFRADVQLIFQDPFASLNPRLTVGQILEEPLVIHRRGGRAERRKRVDALLDLVGLAPVHAQRFPHEFSGGQRQRIAIARALATEPKLLVGDEPVSALDVSIQAQILALLAELKERLGLTLVFISHDLAVVERIADRVGVMYLGRIIELGPARAVMSVPRHPYTRGLMAAVPLPDPRVRGRRDLLEGDVPNPIDPPPGCRFHTRCAFATDICHTETPVLAPTTSTGTEPHEVACHHWQRVSAEAPPVRATAEASEARDRRIALYRRRLAAARGVHDPVYHDQPTGRLTA